MTQPESERLVRVEERQQEMTRHISDIAKALKSNSEATVAIRKTLDELTGVKKFLIWFTSVVGSIGVVIATWLGIHHK